MKKILIPTRFLTAVVIIAAIFGPACNTAGKKTSKSRDTAKTNLLVITLDTTRADRIGAYGCSAAQTPNIDKLAREGVLFEQCYSPVPLTLPAHGSLFTGQYPLGHNVRDNGIYRLTESAETLAERMKTRGMQTYAVISAFVLLSRFGMNQGFDVYDDTLRTHRMYNNYKSEIPAVEVYKKFIQWFDKNYHKQFFAWVHLYDAHEPYRPPKHYAEKFPSTPIGRYDAEIAYVDDCIGNIVKKLEDKNILDNTMIVIVGDHGEAFGEHKENGHGIFCYEETLKVPLIFYHQTMFKKGHRVSNRVNLVDVFPTLLELYGMTIPGAVQGKSFRPMLAGKTEEKKRSFYFESMHGRDEMNWAPLTGIIDGPYKYISLPEPELYHLEQDREEKNNLFWKKNRLAKELDQKLMKAVKRYSETTVTGDARREMTAEDKKHLTSLGYISSFSGKSAADAVTDPKKGIVWDIKIKKIFKTIGKGELDAAESQLQQFNEEHPGLKLPFYYDLKHQLYLQKNEIDKMLDALREAIKLFPDIDRFYIVYALELMKLEKYAEARDACQKLLKVNPNFTRGHILLGEIDEKNRDFGSAVGHYETALSIEPQNISLKIKLAELLIITRSYAKAGQIFENLLERDELAKNTEFLFKVALFNAQQGAPEKAEKLMERVLTLAPGGKYYFSYALVLARGRKIKKALDNMNIALEKYHNELNEKQLQMGRKARAMWQKQLQR